MSYLYKKTCKCGHAQVIEVDKRTAAFDLAMKEIYQLKCLKCGRTDFQSLSLPTVVIDKDLLLEWGNNLDYYFMEQDEDLILAEESYIDIMLEAIDQDLILAEKKTVLLHALCVIIYDQVKSDRARSEKIEQLILELQKRKTLLQAEEFRIMEYIRTVVFPILSLDK